MNAGKGDLQLAIDQGKEILSTYKNVIEELTKNGDLDAAEEFKKAYYSIVNTIKLLQTPDLQNSASYQAKSVRGTDLNEEDVNEADHIKKGKFTAWCKSNGFEGPSIACSKKAKASNSTSAHKMATFYLNTVQPHGKTAKDI